MKSCAICGSHAFNLHSDGINQMGFCDRHYWQREAESRQERCAVLCETECANNDGITCAEAIRAMGQ